MIKNILSITGKPGLFKIISHSSKNLIVEDLATKKRFPVSMRDKVVSLGDIAMYTTSDDKPLGKILDLVYEKEKGNKIDVKKIVEERDLKNSFKEILPDFDEDRVRDSDIKKLYTWYNILVEDGFTSFTEKPEDSKDKDENKDKEAVKE